jgi:RNA polymerase sigma-70 factor, ECF subfamily
VCDEQNHDGLRINQVVRVSGAALAEVIEEASGMADEEGLQRHLDLRFRRPLLRYVLSIVNGDYSFAEDVVQETMLRAWLHVEELDMERAGPWLFTVAHNLAVSTFHRKRDARPREVPIDQEAVPATDRELDRALDATELRRALLELTVEHREILVQLYYFQRSVAEVAALLDIPVGTVRSRAFYALRELRFVFDKRGVTR